MAREVLAMRRKLLGPNTLVRHRLDVAWAGGARGNWRAETLEREALAMRQKLLAPSTRGAIPLYLVGDRMRQRGNLNEAVRS